MQATKYTRPALVLSRALCWSNCELKQLRGLALGFLKTGMTGRDEALQLVALLRG
jgi:hypothetical protein